jgi:serine/threonine protein phosphatase 1
MLQNGVEATLMAYGGDPQQAAAAARDGAVSITRWTNQMRNAMQASPGHYALMSALRRAAYTADGTLLFVSAGIDPERPLPAQADALWWGSSAFVRMEQPYGGFRRVVRGYDRGHGGLKIDRFTATVDGGAGFGGPLLAGCFDHSGELVDMIEA